MVFYPGTNKTLSSSNLYFIGGTAAENKTVGKQQLGIVEERKNKCYSKGFL